MMTKDHANAIMFAYRYDNLTISESLFKQMIGDIAIMRNPWPIFSIAALSGAACLIYDHFFSYETMWIAVVVFLVLLALCFFAYCKYEHWLAKKLNPYVVAYQSDHNLENLKHGLDRWHLTGVVSLVVYSLERLRFLEYFTQYSSPVKLIEKRKDKVFSHFLM